VAKRKLGCEMFIQAVNKYSLSLCEDAPGCNQIFEWEICRSGTSMDMDIFSN
jgi:hypothetical protein